jgi:Max protein
VHVLKDSDSCVVYNITNMSDDEEKIDVGESEGIGSSSVSSLQFGGSDRRAHHNALERKRRDHIKDSFYQLRDSIPQATGEKISRAAILNKATDFIKEMRDVTSANETEIENLRRENMILDEQVKRLEEARASGSVQDIDGLLEEAQRTALAKHSALSSVPKTANTHTRGGVVPGDMKPGITGTGMVLNALTTSQGLSQLVSPADHTYQGINFSPASLRLKSDLAGQSTQRTSQPTPPAVKNNVHSSLAALSSSLRTTQHQTAIQLSTSSLPSKMTGTASVAKVPNSSGRGSGSVVIRTPVVTNAARQRGVVTATTFPVAEDRSKHSESGSTSVQNVVSSSCTTSTQPASSSSTPQSTASQITKDTTNVLQTLLSASPLELNTVLQNLLLSAANTSPSALSDTQKTMISTLVALTGNQGDQSKATGSSVEDEQVKDVVNGSTQSPPPAPTTPLNPQELLNTEAEEPPAKKPKSSPDSD